MSRPFTMRRIVDVNHGRFLMNGTDVMLECGHTKNYEFAKNPDKGRKVRCYECGAEDAESPGVQP